MQRHVFRTLALGALLVVPGQAVANAMCADRAKFVDQLEKKYSEQISARGLQSSDRLLEIFTSSETGSFTVLLTRPDGVSCVLATGTNWVQAAPALIPSGIEG